MQAIWRGVISFGLISIPIRLYGATEEKSLRFNLLHKEDSARVKNNRTCTECGKDNLTKDDLVKAYEYEKGSWVTFTDEELDSVSVPTSHAIDVVSFVDSDEIDPIFYSRSYYLAPEDLGTKAYALLVHALTDSKRVAIAKIAIRDKERLATLRIRDNVIVLETMFWPDEVRDLELSGEQPEIRANELKMAASLIDSMTEPFDATKFHDTYREALLEAVSNKVEGREIVRPSEPTETGEVIDLMDALKKSIEEAKSRREAQG